MRLWRISQLAIGALLLALIISEINCSDFDGNDLGYNAAGNGYSRQQQQQQASGGRGFAETAKDLLTSPAGQLAVSFAKEMISRSAGNSQVDRLGSNIGDELCTRTF